MSPFKSSITKNLGKFLEVFESRNIGSANLADADKEWGDSSNSGSVYFDSPGSGSWTVPPGVTAARFTIIGGGGFWWSV